MLQRYTAEVRGMRTAVTLESPPDHEHHEALILAPGLASSELVDLRHELAMRGHATVSFEQPRAGYMHWFGNVEELRARVVGEVADKTRTQFGIARCALVGHSLGAVDAIKVLNMTDDSDAVSSLELLAGAGMTGESFWKIASRLGSQGIDELIKGNHKLVLQTIMNGLRNPAQLLLEGKYGQRDIVEELGSAAKNNKVGLLQLKNDVIFPDELLDPKIREMVRIGALRYALADLATHACHAAPYCDPGSTAESLDTFLTNR